MVKPKMAGTCPEHAKPPQEASAENPTWSSKLTVDNAITYLKEVEKCLPPEQFCEFLEIIEDFKQSRITTKTVVTKVRCIFEGTPNLISGFNMFLPPEFHIRDDKFSIALELVKKIRDRFEKKQPKLLQKFVETLASFQADVISLSDTRSKVESLFEEHPDLLTDFDTFLPLGPNAEHSSAEIEVADDDDDNSDALSDLSASSQKYMIDDDASVSTLDDASQQEQGGSIVSKQGKGQATTAATQKTSKGQTKPGKLPSAEKRKAMEPEDHSRVEAGGERWVRRRLVTIGRLQQLAMSKSLAGGPDRPQRRARKLVASRGVGRRSVLSVESLAQVVPSTTLQRVQAVLRAMQSSGTSGQQGSFPSFLARP